MAGLVCLTIGIICALIARVLLLIAAFNVSIWWAVGVFLPFGPTLFRLSYPEAARSSFIFRVGTLACIFLYVVLGPGALITPSYKPLHRSQPKQGYAAEIAGKFVRPGQSKRVDSRSLGERLAANAREFERLNKWDEALRVQKRDLPRSDVEANRAYNIDFAEYQAALAAATTEKQVLATASGN